MSLMISCFLLTLLSELSKTGSRLFGGEACAFFPFQPSLLVEVGGILEGTLVERSSHLFFLLHDFLGVGWAEEEGTFCPEGEDDAGRFRMLVIRRSGLMLSARLRFKLSSSLSVASNFFFRPTMTLIHPSRSPHTVVF
jgi:hypothetical protein